MSCKRTYYHPKCICASESLTRLLLAAPLAVVLVREDEHCIASHHQQQQSSVNQLASQPPPPRNGCFRSSRTGDWVETGVEPREIRLTGALDSLVGQQDKSRDARRCTDAIIRWWWQQLTDSCARSVVMLVVMMANEAVGCDLVQ